MKIVVIVFLGLNCDIDFYEVLKMVCGVDVDYVDY